MKYALNKAASEFLLDRVACENVGKIFIENRMFLSFPENYMKIISDIQRFQVISSEKWTTNWQPPPRDSSLFLLIIWNRNIPGADWTSV